MVSLYVLIILFSVLALGLLFTLNFLYKRTNAYTNQFVDIHKFKRLKRVDDKSVDVVVLGSNAPKFAFDFTDVKELNCQNWAIGPETFQYDFVILKKFSEKLKRGATIIWPVCPGKFFLDKFKSSSPLVKYYSILGRNEFPDYNKLQCLKDYKYPLVFHPKLIKRLIKDIYQDKKMDLEYNPMNEEEVAIDASWWIHECWNPEFNINIENMAPLSDGNRMAVEFNISVIHEAITYCRNNGFNIIFAYLPLTKELGDFFSTDYVKNHMTRYLMSAIGGESVRFVDYMRDERFQNRELYINSFFMNRKGARIFTNTFLKENIAKK